MVPVFKDFTAKFLESVGKPLQKDVSLREFSHFKIGGMVDYFFEATSVSELAIAICLARDFQIPVYLVGGGYNILFADDGYRGLILKNSVLGITKLQDSEIEIYSGTAIREVLNFCTENSFSGLEFMAGIPGTVGGAVFGNAGAFERNIGECLQRASILDSNSKTVGVDNSHFKFGYRHSGLKEHHDILLKASFIVKKSKKEDIANKIQGILEIRRDNHPPWDTACAGSYFKNPILPDGTKIPAAKLLDKVGAKGHKVGGASVYEFHANFIINTENATARDVRDLASELKRRVQEEFGIRLEEEVIYLPEFGTTL
jgi:UDP-N-acetylmuramate dehydrogenase